MSVTAPLGFRAARVAAGLKTSGERDVAVVINDGPSRAAAAVFTRNRVKAAPVLWSQQVVAGGRVRAVALNSGGANACTGPLGFQDTHATAERLARSLSTGAPTTGALPAADGTAGESSCCADRGLRGPGGRRGASKLMAMAVEVVGGRRSRPWVRSNLLKCAIAGNILSGGCSQRWARRTWPSSWSASASRSTASGCATGCAGDDRSKVDMHAKNVTITVDLSAGPTPGHAIPPT